MRSHPPLEILVIDDEIDVCDLLADHLRSHGYDVATASDGRAALVALERSPGRFSVIFADLHLPGADGLEVLRAARAANPSIYVVIITGYATLDAAIQAVRLGAYDFLTKPFTLGQIDVVMGRILDRRRLEEENRRLVDRATNPPQAPTPVHKTLDGIEARLARIEMTLSTIVQRLP